jgi:hypothetical protein
MSRVVRVKNDEYKIIVEYDNPDEAAARITLDTTGSGSSIAGTVVVRGDLLVEGTTTTVESVDTTIADNILTLNAGETGAGITLTTAGIELDRGTENNARFVFDEDVPVYNGVDTTGAFLAEDAVGNVLPLSSNSINHTGTIYITPLNSFISVGGEEDYEENIFSYDVPGGIIDNSEPLDDDALVNAKALEQYVDFRLTEAIIGAISDADTSFVAEDFDTNTTESKFIITVDGVNTGNIYGNRTEIHNIKIQNNEISTLNDDSTNQDLILYASGTGNVQIDDGLILTTSPFQAEDIGINPADNPPTDGVKIYGSAEGSGATGISFVNSSGTAGELISKDKALLYAMLF